MDCQVWMHLMQNITLIGWAPVRTGMLIVDLRGSWSIQEFRSSNMKDQPCEAVEQQVILTTMSKVMAWTPTWYSCWLRPRSHAAN